MKSNYLKGQCISTQSLGTYYYLTTNLDSAFLYYNQALALRQSLGDSSMISGTLNNLGNLLEKRGQYNEAIKHYNNANSYLDSSQIKKRVRLVSNISAIYQRMGSLDSALFFNLQAFKLYGDEIKDSSGYANCYLTKGNIYESMLDFDLAKEAFEKSLSVYIILNDERRIAKAMNNLGNVFMKKGDIEKAKSYYQSSLIQFTNINSTSGAAGAEQNLAMIFKLNGHFQKATEYLEKSLAKWQVLDNNQKEAEILTQLGIILANRKNYYGSLKRLEKAEMLLEYNPDLKLDLYKWLAQVNSVLGKHKKAASYFAKCLIFKDSLNLGQKKYFLLERANLEKQNRIVLLEKEQKNQLERQAKEAVIRTALVFGILLLSLLFFAYYKYVSVNLKKKDAELQLKAKQDKIESLLKDQELVSIRQVLEIQEGERKRIAQDLHDRLGGMLSMVKVHFSNTNKKIEDFKVENNQSLEKAATLIDEACDEVRKIAHNLSSGVLKNFGLVAAVDYIKKTLINTGQYDVEFVTHNLNARIGSEIEVITYRIIQELISNIIRHAYASEISIQLIRKNGSLFIEVMDNGRGYDLSTKNSTSGIGFKNIESRILPMKGTLKIDSQTGKGTTVFVEIPINEMT